MGEVAGDIDCLDHYFLRSNNINVKIKSLGLDKKVKALGGYKNSQNY